MLPIRAALYTLSDNAFWLLGVQLLDGVGAGIYQALIPLVIADVMRGTARYNLAQGAIATTQGVGASISALATGEVTDHFGANGLVMLFGKSKLAEAEKLYEEAARCTPADAMQKLDAEHAREEAEG